MLFKYTLFYKHTAFSSQPQYANDFSILSLVLYAYNMFKIITAAVINIATSEGLAAFTTVKTQRQPFTPSSAP